MGTYIKLDTRHNYITTQNFSGNEATNEIKNDTDFEYRIFNDENLKKFEELVQNEPWGSLIDDNLDLDTDYLFSNFLDRYNKLYNDAFPLKTSNITKRKNQRRNPKPWIIPWLEDACSRKNNLYHKFIKDPTEGNKIQQNEKIC